jgi:membrane protein DedA with SNARE-associated domain
VHPRARRATLPVFRGAVVVFAMLVVCGLGLPMPEDVVLVAGGVLARLETDSAIRVSDMFRDPRLWVMITIGYCGIICGDSATFWAGRRYGAHLAEHPLLRRVITPDKREKVGALMRRWGDVAVFVARYLPGLRAPTYFTAGDAGVAYWRFLALDSVAALISAPLWVCLGYYFADDVAGIINLGREFSRHVLMAVLLAAGIVFALVWWRGRRKAGVPGERAKSL